MYSTIAGFFLGLLLAWCVVPTPSHAQEERLDDEGLRLVAQERDRWVEFCERNDCDVFPTGYLTRAFQGELFYFPFNATMGRPQSIGNVFPVAPVGPSPSAVRDFNDDGLMVRSYDEVGRIHFHWKFEDLIEWYTGTLFELPRTAGVFVSVSLAPTVSHDPVAHYFGHPDGFSSYLQSQGATIGASFVLFDISTLSQQHRYGFLSNGPLLENQWITGICSEWMVCEFILWPDVTDPDVRSYLILVKNYRLSPSGLRPECFEGEQSESLACQETADGLDFVPVLFEDLEKLLDFLRTDPSSNVGVD